MNLLGSCESGALAAMFEYFSLSLRERVGVRARATRARLVLFLQSLALGHLDVGIPTPIYG